MKIGRNETCPCGSGKKYKRCCAGNAAVGSAAVEEQQKKVTLSGAIEEFQVHASLKKERIKQLGVFLLFSDKEGDSWVLEVTDSDCIKIADQGKPLDVPLNENEETIEMNWSHTFSFKNKRLVLNAYRSKEVLSLNNAPSQQLYSKARKILKRVSPEFMEQVHVSD